LKINNFINTILVQRRLKFKRITLKPTRQGVVSSHASQHIRIGRSLVGLSLLPTRPEDAFALLSGSALQRSANRHGTCSQK
jgi:hypothetical protein